MGGGGGTLALGFGLGPVLTKTTVGPTVQRLHLGPGGGGAQFVLGDSTSYIVVGLPVYMFSPAKICL